MISIFHDVELATLYSILGALKELGDAREDLTSVYEVSANELSHAQLPPNTYMIGREEGAMLALINITSEVVNETEGGDDLVEVSVKTRFISRVDASIEVKENQGQLLPAWTATYQTDDEKEMEAIFGQVAESILNTLESNVAPPVTEPQKSLGELLREKLSGDRPKTEGGGNE